MLQPPTPPPITTARASVLTEPLSDQWYRPIQGPYDTRCSGEPLGRGHQVALRVGLSALHVLEADKYGEQLAQAAGLEHALDLDAGGAGGDRDRHAGRDPAHAVRRLRVHGRSRPLRLHVELCAALDQVLQQPRLAAAAEPFQHQPADLVVGVAGELLEVE